MRWKLAGFAFVGVAAYFALRIASMLSNDGTEQIIIAMLLGLPAIVFAGLVNTDWSGPRGGNHRSQFR